MQQAEEELSVDDILKSIRKMLTREMERHSSSSSKESAKSSKRTAASKKQNASLAATPSVSDPLLTASAVEALVSAENAADTSMAHTYDTYLENSRWQKEKIYRLTTPVEADVFVLTPEMRADRLATSQETIPSFAKTTNPPGAQTHIANLSPEAVGQIRTLLDDWMTQNLPRLMDAYLKAHKKK